MTYLNQANISYIIQTKMDTDQIIERKLKKIVSYILLELESREEGAFTKRLPFMLLRIIKVLIVVEDQVLT